MVLESHLRTLPCSLRHCTMPVQTLPALKDQQSELSFVAYCFPPFPCFSWVFCFYPLSPGSFLKLDVFLLPLHLFISSLAKLTSCLFSLFHISPPECGQLFLLKESYFPLFLLYYSSSLLHWSPVFNRLESAATWCQFTSSVSGHLFFFLISTAFYHLPHPLYKSYLLNNIVRTLSNEKLHWWDTADKYYLYYTDK